MEEFLLTLLTLTQELDVIDNERINGAKLALKTSQVSLLDRSYKSIDEIFAIQQLDYRAIESLLSFATDGVQ